MYHLRIPDRFDFAQHNDAIRKRNLRRLFGSTQPRPRLVTTALDEAAYDQVDPRPVVLPDRVVSVAHIETSATRAEPWQQRTLRHRYGRFAEIVREIAADIDDEVRTLHGDYPTHAHLFLMADCDRLVADLQRLAGHERQPTLLDRAAQVIKGIERDERTAAAAD